jgi:hypothetical protein
VHGGCRLVATLLGNLVEVAQRKEIEMCGSRAKKMAARGSAFFLVFMLSFVVRLGVFIVKG